MDRFYPGNAEDTWRIRTMILSDDISDDDRIDGREKCDGDYVTRTVRKTLRRMIAEGNWEATDNCFHRKGQDEQGKVIRSTHIRSRWQNIQTKLSWVIGQAEKATTLFDTWNCRLQMKF